MRGRAARIYVMLRDPLWFALRLPVRTLPDPLHAFVLTRVFNRVLRHQPLAVRLRELEGRTVGLHIEDAHTKLYLRIENGRLVPAAAGACNVTIRGALRDFVALATRAEDPDTLFFHRRLCIEGDVETGLHVKNALDTFDFDWEARVRDWLPAPVADTVVHWAHAVRDFAVARR